MASIVNDPGGKRRVQFTDTEGKRRTIRLGRVSQKAAQSFKAHLEPLLAARAMGTAPDPQTARWVGELSDALHDRLARVGLVEPREKREAPTIERVVDAFVASAQVKESTHTRYERARSVLIGYFGADRDMDTITPSEADAWRASLVDTGYASSTISRDVKYARQFAAWACKRGMLESNPFAHLKAGAQSNSERAYFVSREEAERIIDAAPDAEWRLLIALSRYCGLRVPSEALALTWADIDWEHSRIHVRSSKTAHHKGGGRRTVPIFPEVRPYLMDAYEAADEGAERVITRYANGSNLNPQLHRIIRYAGLEAWPRVWHNMRASCQTELMNHYPMHTVCAWIGNTAGVALEHYLQVTSADWERAITSGAKCGAPAAQNAAQHTTADDGTRAHDASQTDTSDGFRRGCASECTSVQSDPMGPVGFEPTLGSPPSGF